MSEKKKSKKTQVVMIGVENVVEFPWYQDPPTPLSQRLPLQKVSDVARSGTVQTRLCDSNSFGIPSDTEIKSIFTFCICESAVHCLRTIT